MAKDETGLEAKMGELGVPNPLQVITDAVVHSARELGARFAAVAGVPDESRQSALAAELEAWWHAQADAEVERVVPKAIEYGGVGSAVDLVWMGHEIAGMIGRPVSDEEATELGIWVYILGKVARWKAAILEGRRVSDDTLHDISVYCRMAQRNREVGGWPYPNEERT